ncbi:MAG TPA: MEDS domain-containing protein [Vicinamibacterales bacterium]|nr:MEDS domain-containing protein [Vicinamibacterales bacterium]
MRRSARVDYRHGHHVCTLSTSRAEHVRAAVEFIQAGLARGEQCGYACWEQTPEQFREELSRAGVDVEAEEARGALAVIGRDQGHLAGGAFDAARTIERIEAALSDALNAGFSGLCGAGDMTWLLDGVPGSHELLAYEALLNYFCSNRPLVLLCQYSRDKLPARIIDSCLATHPYVLAGTAGLLRNPFYEMPERAMIRSRDGAGIGEKLTRLDALSMDSAVMR